MFYFWRTFCTLFFRAIRFRPLRREQLNSWRVGAVVKITVAMNGFEDFAIFVLMEGIVSIFVTVRDKF